MSFFELSKLIIAHWRLMLLTGLTIGGGVYYFTSGQEKAFGSKMLVNTGVVSGYNIENHDSDSRVDRDYTRNELENLISLATAYETSEALATELLVAYLLLEQPDPHWISPAHFTELELLISPALRQQLVDSTRSITLSKVEKYRDQDRDNEIYDLIYSDHAFFGIEKLQQIRVNRKGASDLLEFSYATTDPAVCRQTLLLLSKIFVKRYQVLKEKQSADVLGFFEEATSKSAAKLRAAEEKLLDFQVENNIINYYEQTRFIADKKEDLDELFFQEVMALEATRSTLQRLEEQMDSRVQLYELNQRFLDKRKEISRISNHLAQEEIAALVNDTPVKKPKKEWKFKLSNLESEVKEMVQTALEIDQTPEGIASDELLTAWLKAIINQEQSVSRLEVIKKRKQEFKEIYSQFAPWGSSLKKIEREIALAEDAYLENLHSYNQARLHLQNTSMAGNLSLLDAPFFPTKEKASKRLLLVVVGFLAGVFLILGAIILLEFLDQTLKHPILASKRIGIELAGAYPLFPSQYKRKHQTIDFDYISNCSTDLILQQLGIGLNTERPRKILLSSSRGREGASFIGGILAQRLRDQGKNVLFLATENSPGKAPSYLPHTDTYTYQHETKLDDEKLHLQEKWDVILIELPGILAGKNFPELTQKIDQSILVARANRTWSSADERALHLYEKIAGQKPALIINGTPLSGMETILGEVPRRRSKIRVLMKQLFHFNFSGSAKI